MGMAKLQAFQTVVASATFSFCDAAIRLAKELARFSSSLASVSQTHPPPLGFGVAGFLRAASVFFSGKEMATLLLAESTSF